MLSIFIAPISAIIVAEFKKFAYSVKDVRGVSTVMLCNLVHCFL